MLWVSKKEYDGPIHAVISGYFGYGNSGDDTVLDCLVSEIRREYPGAVIAVLCHDPEAFGRAHGVIGIGRYDILSIIRVLRKTRLLISGGGSLLQNVTSSRSLRYYAGIITLAKMCGARVFIYANGIGPLIGRTGKRIACKAVMRADRISVRDSASKETLADIGVPEKRVSVTADPAFRLALAERVDTSDIKRSIGMTKGRRYFAVSLRYSVCEGDSGSEVCRALRDIYLKLGLIPVFVSMQESEDGELCRMMAENTCGEALVIPPQPSEVLCSLMGDMAFVVSMRLHMMIYAAAVGTPSVVISVDPKLDAAAKILGTAEIVCEGDLSSESFLEAAVRALSHDRDALIKVSRSGAAKSLEDAAYAADMMRDNCTAEDASENEAVL